MITVVWADEWQSITLTNNPLDVVFAGSPLGIEGPGHAREGARLHGKWRFASGLDGTLAVGYDEGGGLDRFNQTSGDSSWRRMIQMGSRFVESLYDGIRGR